MNLRNPVFVTSAIGVALCASVGVASLLSSADPTGSKFLQVIKQESSRNAIIRNRINIEHQMTEEERDSAQIRRIEQAIEEAQPDSFHPAAPTELTVDELIKRCFDTGFTNSRLIKCLGAAEDGKAIDMTRY